MTQISVLSTAQLIIYAILSLPTIYNLYRHGKHEFIGWLYLLVFCVLRMTGNGIYLSSPTSSGATITSNIGLSPLLLAMIGVVHEGRFCRIPNLNYKLETAMVLALHILVGAAIGLIASGAAALTSANPAASNMTLIKTGIVIMLLAWLIVAGVTAVSIVMPVRIHDEGRVLEGQDRIDGTRLLKAVLLSIPFMGVRVLYSVVAFFTEAASLNPISGSIALRVCLSVLPEMTITILLILVGLWTRNIGRKRQSRRSVVGLRTIES